MAKDILSICNFWSVCLFLICFFISPKSEEYENLKNEVESLETNLNSLKVIADQNKEKLYEVKISNLRAEIDKNNKKLESLSRIIPSKPMTEEILKIITGYANLDRLIVNTFKIEKEEEVYLYYEKDSDSLKTISKQDQSKKELKQQIPKDAILVKKIYLSSNFSGDINKIKNFLNNLSKSERLIIAENVVIKKESGNLLNFNISFVTYYLPEEVSK